MVGFRVIILMEGNTTDKWNKYQMKDEQTKFSKSRFVEMVIFGGGRKGKELLVQRVQGDSHSRSEL
jgi:hypothetical protein